MNTIVLEPTNQCNRSCRHCFRNKADPVGFLPIQTADAVLSQARDLGFKTICLTGGEVALYPYLGDLLRRVAELGLEFSLLTNGYRFPEYVLPLLLEPKVKERLSFVCFSLDGDQAATHDGLRGARSFREVVEGMTLCYNHRLPLALKSTITTANRKALTDLALLGARNGVLEHSFLYPFPTPGFISNGLLPTPREVQETIHRIQTDLMGVTRNIITVDCHSLGGSILDCTNLVDFLNVDYQGNLIFCCTLSHVTLGDGIPSSDNGELVADLKEVSLKDAIVRQFRKATEIMEARLNSRGNPASIISVALRN